MSCGNVLPGVLLACLLGLMSGNTRTPAEEPLRRLLDEPLQQDEPSFYVQAEVNRPDHYYREGDALTVTATSEQDAYLYVLYQQADGQAFLIFPNSVQRENRVAAKTTVTIPAPDDRFRWRIGPPFGEETVKVLASKEPLENLEAPGLRQKRLNPVGLAELRGLATRLAETPAPTWAESHIKIQTAPRSDAGPPPPGRRFGVFFGASEYEFNAEVKQATEGKWEPNVHTPANNAIVIGRLMQSLGRLNEVRVHVNAEATKANLEEAITQWLPAVSRPGDTVFIMYCGHGSQIPDDNGDEPDGKDEYLLTHDYVDVGILDVLLKRKEAGNLDPALEPRVAQWLKLIRGAGSLAKADEILTRYSCPTDDLFGHWLQRLPGRQIVVLMDTCHSGGLARDEKSLDRPNAAIAFDFLDGELGRLKDIGQPESVLLAACSAQQSSYALRVSDEDLERLKAQLKGEVEERVMTNLAVFSYYVAESLLAEAPPLTIEQVQAHCETGMKQYFESVNEYQQRAQKEPLTPHTAHLFNYCRRPVVIKP